MDAIFSLDSNSDRWDVLMDMISGLPFDAYIADHQTAWCTIPAHWTVAGTIVWLDEVRELTGATVQIRI
jgi:hypothetical protein